MKRLMILVVMVLTANLIFANGGKEEVLAEYNNALQNENLETTDNFILHYGEYFNKEEGNFSTTRIQVLMNSSFNKALEPGLDLSDSELEELLVYINKIPIWSDQTGTDYDRNNFRDRYNHYVDVYVNLKNSIQDYRRQEKEKEEKELRFFQSAIDSHDLVQIQRFIDSYPNSIYLQDAINEKQKIEDSNKEELEKKKKQDEEQNRNLELKRNELSQYIEQFEVEGINQDFLSKEIGLSNQLGVTGGFGSTVHDLIAMMVFMNGKMTGKAMTSVTYSIKEGALLNEVEFDVELDPEDDDPINISYNLGFSKEGFLNVIDAKILNETMNAKEQDEKTRLMLMMLTPLKTWLEN